LGIFIFCFGDFVDRVGGDLWLLAHDFLRIGDVFVVSSPNVHICCVLSERKICWFCLFCGTDHQGEEEKLGFMDFLFKKSRTSKKRGEGGGSARQPAN